MQSWALILNVLDMVTLRMMRWVGLGEDQVSRSTKKAVAVANFGVSVYYQSKDSGDKELLDALIMDLQSSPVLDVKASKCRISSCSSSNGKQDRRDDLPSMSLLT